MVEKIIALIIATLTINQLVLQNKKTKLEIQELKLKIKKLRQRE
ncbi:hypothetical protein [Peptoniphilus asaccharolyticus]